MFTRRIVVGLDACRPFICATAFDTRMGEVLMAKFPERSDAVTPRIAESNCDQGIGRCHLRSRPYWNSDRPAHSNTCTSR